MKNEKLTSNSLKMALWTTLKAVKSKRINPAIANSVASQSREIMRVVRAEIDIARLAGQKPGTALITFKADKK